MSVPVWMTAGGILLGGVAPCIALAVRRGETKPDENRPDDHDLADYWHAKYDECEQERAKAETPPPPVRKRRKT